jgi:GTPase KRas protein
MASEAQASNEFRITVLGGGSVGKSALTIQLVHEYFVHDYDPTIEDCYKKIVDIDGEIVTMEILDTAGQDDFHSMQDQWIREGQGFLVVYAINSRTSLDTAKNLREKILRAKDSNRVPVVLVGNKCDLNAERQVPTDEGQTLATAWGCPFFETSAKSKINNLECYFQVIREIKRSVPKPKETKQSKSFFDLCTIL